MRTAGRQATTKAVAASVACVLLLGAPEHPAAAIYSCQAAGGRIILRDVPCKRNETARPSGDGASAATPPRRHPATLPATVSRPIAPEEVQVFIDALDAAHARRDAAAILTYFAADVALEFEYRLRQGVQVARYDKTSYAALLRETFAAGAPYIHQRESPRIVLSPDRRQAEVIGTVHETVLVDGTLRQGTTRSRLTVEWRDARLEITLVRGSVRFDAGPEAAPPAASAASHP